MVHQHYDAMTDDVNGYAIEVNLENLVLPARLYRVVENDPVAEKRKQSFLERWGIFDVKFNAHGTNQPIIHGDLRGHKVRAFYFFFVDLEMI